MRESSGMRDELAAILLPLFDFDFNINSNPSKPPKLSQFATCKRSQKRGIALKAVQSLSERVLGINPYLLSSR